MLPELAISGRISRKLPCFIRRLSAQGSGFVRLSSLSADLHLRSPEASPLTTDNAIFLFPGRASDKVGKIAARACPVRERTVPHLVGSRLSQVAHVLRRAQSPRSTGAFFLEAFFLEAFILEASFMEVIWNLYGGLQVAFETADVFRQPSIAEKPQGKT